jgi:hypothetical protein
MRLSRRRALLGLLALAPGLGRPAFALAQSDAAESEAQAAEYRIKAAFLYKFLGFVEWPPATAVNASAPFVIGVLGGDGFAQTLARTVAGRQIRGRPIVVRSLNRGERVGDLQVLFIGRDEAAHAPALLTQAKGQPLLTVSETGASFDLDSMINFVVIDDKVRFDIALQRAEASGLKISARLLAVARRVLPNST